MTQAMLTKKYCLSMKGGVGTFPRQAIFVYQSCRVGTIYGLILLPILFQKDVGPGVVDPFESYIIWLTLNSQDGGIHHSQVIK